MDRHSKLARAIETAAGVTAVRFTRWPRDLLPDDWPPDVDAIGDHVVAHLRELDGLVGRGKANTATGWIDYYDRVALILAARGHECPRLLTALRSAVDLTDVQAQLDALSAADRADALECMARGIRPDSWPEFMRDVMNVAYRNTSQRYAGLEETDEDKLDATPEGAIHELILSTLHGIWGQGSYYQEAHAASAGVSPTIVKDARVLKLRDLLARFVLDPSKVVNTFNSVPAGTVVSTAVMLRPYAHLLPVAFGVRMTPDDTDMLAALAAPFVLGLSTEIAVIIAELVKLLGGPEKTMDTLPAYTADAIE